MKLSFSQRNGLAPIPNRMKVGELSGDFRNRLWTLVYSGLEKDRPVTSIGGRSSYVRGNWGEVCKDFWVNDNNPIDEFNPHIDNLKSSFKVLVLDLEYNMVFDFIEFVLNHGFCPTKFKAGIVELFNLDLIAYALDPKVKTIIPVVTEAEQEAVLASLDVVGKSKNNGASAHLSKAAAYINNKSYADSVRESIHAVESIACILTGDSKATLGAALKKLEDSGIEIHAAFKAGLGNIYGYTSDERGIRHASLNNDTKIDEADALFMFGACAAFCSYLIAKGEVRK